LARTRQNKAVTTKKRKQKSSSKTTTQDYSASRLMYNKLGQYVVYDKNGKVVIITHHKRIAERYANGSNDGTLS